MIKVKAETNYNYMPPDRPGIPATPAQVKTSLIKQPEKITVTPENVTQHVQKMIDDDQKAAQMATARMWLIGLVTVAKFSGYL